MKTSRIAHWAVVSLLFGVAVLACGAQDRPSGDKDRPKQDDKHQQAKRDAQRGQQPKPSTREEQSAPQQRRQPAQSQQQRPEDSRSRAPQARQPQSKPVSREQEHTQQQRGTAAPQRGQAQHHVQQAAWQQHRAGNWQSDHRTWQQRGGYNGYRIPDNRFRGYFGPDHGFRIQGLPFMVVGGYPRFQYGGYWLSVVDPWPANWGDDWYNNDQVYVAYVDNGYYLYNRSYPGVGIAVSISM
jgi:hypothetical protein